MKHISKPITFLLDELARSTNSHFVERLLLHLFFIETNFQPGVLLKKSLLYKSSQNFWPTPYHTKRSHNTNWCADRSNCIPKVANVYDFIDNFSDVIYSSLGSNFYSSLAEVKSLNYISDVKSSFSHGLSKFFWLRLTCKIIISSSHFLTFFSALGKLVIWI